jgi:hypothetical protein
MKSVRPVNLAALLSIVLLLASCGGTHYLNKEYRFPAPDASVLAIFPTEFHSKPIDDALSAAFSGSPMKQVLTPGELEKRLKLASYFHARIKAGGKKDSLQSLLDEKHYTYLVTTLSPATLLLIPTRMEFTTTSRYTYSDFSFKLYDLRSGVMLYMSSHHDRSDNRGRKAETQLIDDGAKQIAREINSLFPGR